MSALSIQVVSAGGGHGASTVAIAIAYFASESAPVSLSGWEPDVLGWMLGRTPTPSRGVGFEFLRGRSEPIGDTHPAVAIVDRGRVHSRSEEIRQSDRDLVIGVLRGPSVVGTRAFAVASLVLDGVVIVEEPGSAVSVADASHAVEAPVVATIPADPSIRHATDAGILERRLRTMPQFKALRECVTEALVTASRDDRDSAQDTSS